MGAFVEALLERNTNKTNNKQHINRGYDSESGHHYLKNPPKRWVFTFLQPDSPSNSVRLFAANTTALKLMNDLLQNAHVSLVQYPFIPTHF